MGFASFFGLGKPGLGTFGKIVSGASKIVLGNDARRENVAATEPKQIGVSRLGQRGATRTTGRARQFQKEILQPTLKEVASGVRAAPGGQLLKTGLAAAGVVGGIGGLLLAGERIAEGLGIRGGAGFVGARPVAKKRKKKGHTHKVHRRVRKHRTIRHTHRRKKSKSRGKRVSFTTKGGKRVSFTAKR